MRQWAAARAAARRGGGPSVTGETVASWKIANSMGAHTVSGRTRTRTCSLTSIRTRTLAVSLALSEALAEAATDWLSHTDELTVRARDATFASARPTCRPPLARPPCRSSCSLSLWPARRLAKSCPALSLSLFSRSPTTGPAHQALHSPSSPLTVPLSQGAPTRN